MANDFNDVVNCCSDLLINFPNAENVRAYANKRLSNAGQNKFGFGYFPNSENLFALQAVVGEEKLAKLDLIYDKIMQDGVSSRKIRCTPFEDHNIIMPYRDVYGEIIGLVGRTLLDETVRREAKIPKYKNTSFDKRRHLFGLYEARETIIKNDAVYVVEGQFDCITAHDKGLNNVVALGSSNMAFEQFSLLMRYTSNFMLLLDNDDAGRVGSDKIIQLYSNYANIKAIHIPKDFKDIDEYLTYNDIESLIYATNQK